MNTSKNKLTDPALAASFKIDAPSPFTPLPDDWTEDEIAATCKFFGVSGLYPDEWNENDENAVDTAVDALRRTSIHKNTRRAAISYTITGSNADASPSPTSKPIVPAAEVDTFDPLGIDDMRYAYDLLFFE